MSRHALRLAHRWVGLALALPLLVQAITGCILVCTPVWQDMRPLPRLAVGQAQPASAILEAARLPGLAPIRYFPAQDGSAATVELGTPGTRRAERQMLVDPVSLAVLADRPTSAAYRWVHAVHENLLLPTMPGRSIVGWFGAGLLAMGLSGVVLWWPASLRPGRWRAAMTVARKARGARLQRELHGAAGFWTCVMLVVMSVSGMTLAFPQTSRALLDVVPVAPPAVEQSATLDIDAVMARAALAVPGAHPIDLRLPERPGRPVLLQAEPAGAWQGAPPVTVVIDPAGRQVLSIQDPRRSFGAGLLGWLRALHFGEAFGLPWRMLVLLCGLALPLLAATGVTLWLLRRRNRMRLATQRRAAMQGAG